MANPDEALLRHARQMRVDDDAVAACWSLVLRAIEAGWLDRADLAESLAALLKKQDHGVEELLFDFLGTALRVSFLSERYECPPDELCAVMPTVLAASP